MRRRCGVRVASACIFRRRAVAFRYVLSRSVAFRRDSMKLYRSAGDSEHRTGGGRHGDGTRSQICLGRCDSKDTRVRSFVRPSRAQPRHRVDQAQALPAAAQQWQRRGVARLGLFSELASQRVSERASELANHRARADTFHRRSRVFDFSNVS